MNRLTHETPQPTNNSPLYEILRSASPVSADMPTLGRLLVLAVLAAVFANVAHAVVPPDVGVSDSFEGIAIYPFWTTSHEFGSISLSTDHAYSGSHALKFASSSGGNRGMNLRHIFPKLTKGVVSIAFYDDAPGTETLYEQLTVSDSKNSTVYASVGTMDFDSECYEASFGSGGPNAVCGIYPQTTTTPVRRTPGWHVLSISFGAANVSISIDGNVVFTASGTYDFDTIQLAVTGPSWRPNTVAYFDDFRFMPLTY